MTLILGMAAVDGLVLASDGQLTTGEVRSPGKKIFPLNDKILWAGAGELSLIQRLQERLAGLPQDTPLANLRDQIGEYIKECVSELLQLDFRAQFVSADQDHLVQLHLADFIFAEYSKIPELLHINVFGSPEWMTDRPFVAGNGDLFAYALLSKYQKQHLSLRQASLLAYKVIDEAIAVGAYGLGGPIDLWQISTAGLKNLNAPELKTVAGQARRLRKLEIDLLLEEKYGE
jgi:20S proteasome alpha/beta subunit